jgi:serine/threonine protein kinase
VARDQLLNGRYKKISIIGEGAFGKVYLAEDMYPDKKKMSKSASSNNENVEMQDESAN